jgi:hypothetical protein
MAWKKSAVFARGLLGFLPMERLSFNHGQTQSRAKNDCAKFGFMDML